MTTVTPAVLADLLGPLAPLERAITRVVDDPLGFPGYADKLHASRRGGSAHSVEVGHADIGGLPVIAARGDFRVLGGSMGRAHGERIATALAVARESRLPFVAHTASGGARMQEGMFALIQMSRAAEGVRALREAGLPTISVLGHPTTGGVFASYGSLADIVLAREGATIGFAGPRVVEAFTGAAVGDDSHTARAALAAGLVDGLVGDDAAEVLASWVRLTHPRTRHGALPDAHHPNAGASELAGWEAVERARRPDRPSVRDLIARVFDEHRELSGDRAGADDPAAVAAIARLGGRTVVVVGMDRRGGATATRRPGTPDASGFRKIRRALELARRWEVPAIGFVDTPGADPSPASERAGLAAAIAETFVATLSVAAPTIAVVTGEGGSGGGLAIAASDRVLMQDDAVFEVIAPEGAASILYDDPSRAAEIAPALEPTAAQLFRRGIIDGVLPGPTTTDPDTAARALRAELSVAIAELDADPTRLARRRARYGPTPADPGIV
jgi:acetyl-CoA carboxylase carboxyl transferase subunit beta